MAPLRLIALIVAALATLFALSGCGSGDDGAGLESIDAEAIQTKLAQVEERADSGRCTGDNSALSSLTSLSGFVSSDALNYVDEETRSDLRELLTRLGEQIQSQCEQVSDLTTTTTTETTDTETTDTETDTTTEKTSTTTRETTDTGETTPSPRPPANNGPGNQGGGGGNQGGGNQGGGNSGGSTGPPSDPDGSGGIGPGMIVPILKSTEAGDSVLPSGEDATQADPGTSR